MSEKQNQVIYIVSMKRGNGSWEIYRAYTKRSIAESAATKYTKLHPDCRSSIMAIAVRENDDE